MPHQREMFNEFWSIDRGRILTPPGLTSGIAAAPATHEDPRVLGMTYYDPGSAAYRYHSAMNAAPGGVSAFARWGHANPHCDLRQWDGDEHASVVRALVESADVVHCHMSYECLHGARDHQIHRDFGLFTQHDPSRQLLVRHYHGSIATHAIGEPGIARLVETDVDDALGAVQIGARLYHQRFSPRMHWLPIPVPVDDYAALADAHWRPSKTLRIAHSPTHARIKGTTALEIAVQECRRKGLDVELVMISGMSHADALRRKATCDVTFDSFWLGIQGSGLEGAAMGQAVIAGDADVKAEYEASEAGECPYTFAAGFEELVPLIERLATDDAFRLTESVRVSKYVRRYHSYRTVGARYWRLIADERATRFGGSTEVHHAAA